jgi:ribosomal protein S18 acetylase RimI-like enzyme
LSPKALISIAKKSDAEAIVNYYNQLSEASKQKFAPHPFTTAYLEGQVLESKEYIALIAKDIATNKVIGYAITQLWVFDYDILRWGNYGQNIQNESKQYACFAPSVADAAQHIGIGRQLLEHSIAELEVKGYSYILLWGGVKCTNIPAVRFYLKNDFKLMGHFDYEGGNYDMLLTIDK